MEKLCALLNTESLPRFREDVEEISNLCETLAKLADICTQLSTETHNQTGKQKVAENHIRCSVLALHELMDLKFNSELHRLRLLWSALPDNEKKERRLRVDDDDG